MRDAEESERFWRELKRVRDRVRAVEDKDERQELSIAGLYDAVLQLAADQKAGFERLAQADQQIADRAADAIVSAVTQRLDQRATVIATAASATLQVVAYLWTLGRH